MGHGGFLLATAKLACAKFCRAFAPALCPHKLPRAGFCLVPMLGTSPKKESLQAVACNDS